MTPGAIRLTFTYEGEDIRLESAKHVNMRAPQGDARKELASNVIGNFLELRDDKGRVLYRRAVQSLIPREVEIHDGEGMPPRRVPTEQKEGRFHLVVPALRNAREAVLYQRRLDGKEMRAVDVAKAKLPRRENDPDDLEVN